MFVDFPISIHTEENEGNKDTSLARILHAKRNKLRKPKRVRLGSRGSRKGSGKPKRVGSRKGSCFVTFFRESKEARRVLLIFELFETDFAHKPGVS